MEEEEEKVEVVEEREESGDTGGWEALRGCGGDTVEGLGVRIGGLTTVLKLDEDNTEEEEEEVEDAEEGKCEALLTASHMETLLLSPILLVVVVEVLEDP